jgi:hypothetical protein
MDELKKLRSACKGHSVTITQALAAAMLCMTASFVQDNRMYGNCRSDTIEDVVEDHEGLLAGSSKKYRFLLSVGLRPFGRKNNDKDWTGNTVACAGGAVDFVLPVNYDCRKAFSSTVASIQFDEPEVSPILIPECYWYLAQRCRDYSKDIIMNRGFVQESVRLFGIGMQLVDILQAVEIDARSTSTLGRGFSCGVSNVGKVEINDVDHSRLLQLKEVYYGTSHSRNGVLCQLSSITIEDTFCGCLQFTEPIISKKEAELLVKTLRLFLTAL